MPGILESATRTQLIMAILPTLDTTHPVLIFKASRSTIHHGAVGIARSFGRLGVPVFAVVEDSCTPLATSRYVTKAFVWKGWPRDRKAFLLAMSTIGQIINRPTILIPMDDLSAVFTTENAIALSRWFLLPELSGNLSHELANKASFYSLCTRTGIPCARSVVPHSTDDVRDFIKQTTFPIVVKAAEQWRLLHGRYNVKVIKTREELFKFYEQNQFGEHPQQMILQEYVPGKDWIYHGYCNFKMNLYLSFTGKKLLDYPPGAGSTASGISLRNDALRSQSEEFLRAISYSGITDIDWRQDERDGQYKIMDCNPRVGMNFRMFENSAAIDVVRAQHLNLTGRSIECADMINNRLFIVESYYFLSLVRGGRNALKTEEGRHPPESIEFAWWGGDDMLPFLVMSVRLFVQTIKHALRNLANYATSGFSTFR